MIKYIGSKRKLVPFIVETIQNLLPQRGSVVDLFSGTSRVGYALKEQGYRVIANDHNSYAHTIAQCYIEADLEDVEEDAMKAIATLNALKGKGGKDKGGYFTKTFCQEARFFQPMNGERVDAMRAWIEKKKLAPPLRAVLLVSLMEAADRVDSTTGLQMAYLKQWAQRSYNPLSLRLPCLLPKTSHKKSQAHKMEAQEATRTLSGDVAYLDPPYNQHSYLSNYHIWETLIKWDKPTAYGIARKREECRERKSPFNSKKTIVPALKDIIDTMDARCLVVSFNNEGHISKEQMVDMLSTRGDVVCLEQEHKRYVGAQIGIHNLKGERVGKVSHLRNKEYLFVVSKSLPKKQAPRKQAMPYPKESLSTDLSRLSTTA